MKPVLGWLCRGAGLGLLAFAVFGPLANLALWAVALQWYYPHKLPLSYGLRYWREVFKPTGDAVAALGTSIEIALVTVIVCLALAVPAGYALGRRSLPWRGAILLLMLLPQAFPSVAVYLNIARLFYAIGLNGTVAGVVTVGLVLAFVTMLSVLSVPIMISGGSPTMITVDMAFRVNSYSDYGTANALGFISYLIAGLGGWIYIRRNMRAAAH